MKFFTEPSSWTGLSENLYFDSIFPIKSFVFHTNGREKSIFFDRQSICSGVIRDFKWLIYNYEPPLSPWEEKAKTKISNFPLHVQSQFLFKNEQMCISQFSTK